jgi:nucleoside-diphosphate-sugar epimerase
MKRPAPDDESASFAFDASAAVAAGARRYAQLEAVALATPGIAFVGLRYGFFYGPGTWFHNDGDMGEQVRQLRVPVIGLGHTPRWRRSNFPGTACDKP